MKTKEALEKVTQEQADLMQKMEALDAALDNKELMESIGARQVALLHLQRMAMDNYNDILVDRIELMQEDIKAEEEKKEQEKKKQEKPTEELPEDIVSDILNSLFNGKGFRVEIHI